MQITENTHSRPVLIYGRVAGVYLPIRPGRRVCTCKPCVQRGSASSATIGSRGIPSDLREKNKQKAKQRLIATTPHSKIAATLSQLTRRHFLIATKTPFPVRQTFATNHESQITSRESRRTLNSSSLGSNFGQAPGSPFYRKEDIWQQRHRHQ
jgi:hypothetical protein